ncbi:MAG: amidohydrolase [Bacteroidetes bacterium]|nr:MAG: amidohydrolase [Bacteroidota bacterium]TAG87408.1 MAG: amidohydrolase [Bacteroidota bacterium]
MKKNVLLFLFFCGFILNITAQIVTSPVNGVRDDKENLYAFTNATIFIDYQTKITNATLVIRSGKIENVGANITIPKGATTIDLQGKFIYPAFIDLDSDLGMPAGKKPNFTGFGRENFESERKGAFGWNDAVKAEINAVDVFTPNEMLATELRKLGFGNVLTHHHDGLVRGSGAFINLKNAKAQELILNGKASFHFSLDKGSSQQTYPFSLMGYFAVIRQTYLDAEWYNNLKEKKEFNLSLEAFNKNKNLPSFFELNHRLHALRVDKMGDEFGVQYIIKGKGDEYQRLQELKNTNASFIIPVNFPDVYDVTDPIDASMVSLEEMKHWELAPSNAFQLQKMGINFAFTTANLKNKADFLRNIKRAIEYGLDEKEALKALTFTPAKMVKMENIVGSLKTGMFANFIISSDNIFAKESILHETWVDGQRFEHAQMPKNNISGSYNLTLGTQNYTLNIIGKPDMYAYSIEKLSDSLKVNPVFIRKDKMVSMAFKLAKKGQEEKTGETRLSGWIDGKNMKGTGETPTGEVFNWQATYSKPLTDTTKIPKIETPKLELGKVIYPFVAFGNEQLPKTEDVLFKNATIWTNEKEGIIKKSDVLVKNGKIAQIGENLTSNNVRIIDATNKHLTSGIIDEHSHINLFSINEIQTVSAEVRLHDAVDSEDVQMYRQLAGGTTAAQLLHGSANCIGGQSAIVKFKWGEQPANLLIPETNFIKFALGENVKNGNAGSFGRERYPQTRMGVEQVMEDAFQRAKDYQTLKNTKGAIFRRDLELETLVEILEKKRFITCHSYVQSEIIMLMRIAEKYGFVVNTFTHILEGYKVADKMAKHGAGASSFADWWAYKFEVKDAIPYNPALLMMNNVVTAINSDDAEMARRLNHEAAKAVKYGNVSEEDAWKTVTLNPAKLLHLDNKMGSIKVGKDADLVLWSDNPLSIYAKAEKTMIEGAFYFDREKDVQKQNEIQKERARLIQKMQQAKAGGMPTQMPMFKKGRNFHCDSLAESEEHHDH